MRRSAERWKSIVAGFEASGLTVAEYCHRRGVPVGSFFRWRRVLRSREAGAGEPAFVEAVLRPLAGAASPVVEVRRWRIVVPEGFHPATLGRLVATLERLDLDAKASVAEVGP